MKQKKINPLLTAALLAGMLLVPVPAALSGARAERGSSAGPAKLRFMPLWSPQAQFAGYYMAAKQGFYKKRGLDVEILAGGPQAPAEKTLRTGGCDITLLWLSSALKMRDSGFQLVNVGQIVRKSALLLVAKKSSGVKTPADLNGKKVSIWPDFDTQPKAFFAHEKIRPKIITQSHSVNLFLTGAVTAACAMTYNEYHTILNSGFNAGELVSFAPADYGINFPEDGLYMTRTSYEKNPEAACSFAKASVEGWLYAFEHPREAVAETIEYMHKARLPANEAHQTWMLNAFKTALLPDGRPDNAGLLDEKDYTFTAQELKRAGIIKTFPDYKSFYKNCK
ncbi:MAG: ABC transporter substrate-binding protein [Elusimicrobiaceae bacterium]|nr:ABC transporter substrate-binding protein [Elusimicrobiaceae bacterium]